MFTMNFKLTKINRTFKLYNLPIIVFKIMQKMKSARSL